MWLYKKTLKRRSETKSKDLRWANKKVQFWKPFLLMAPAFFILALFTVVPFVYTIQDAFHETNINDLKGASKISLKSFETVAKDPNFIYGVKNSLYYALITVPLVLIISLVISSAISSVIRKRLRGIFQTIFFLPYVTSAIAISLAFAFIFDWDAGLINKIIGNKDHAWLQDPNGRDAFKVIVTFGVWRGLAFNILIFTTAMLGVDKTLYKSASIDGAGPFKKFMKITLPSINKTTNFLIIMGIIGAIKVFPLGLFGNQVDEAMAHNGSTIMLYIFQQVQDGNNDRAGVSSIYLLLISIGYSIVVKGGFNQFVKGINWLGEKRVSNKIKIR